MIVVVLLTKAQVIVCLRRSTDIKRTEILAPGRILLGRSSGDVFFLMVYSLGSWAAGIKPSWKNSGTVNAIP